MGVTECRRWTKRDGKPQKSEIPFFFFLVNASLFVFVYYWREVINPDNETMQDSSERGT